MMCMYWYRHIVSRPAFIHLAEETVTDKTSTSTNLSIILRNKLMKMNTNGTLKLIAVAEK